jgi:hypothetical protein
VAFLTIIKFLMRTYVVTRLLGTNPPGGAVNLHHTTAPVVAGAARQVTSMRRGFSQPQA